MKILLNLFRLNMLNNINNTIEINLKIINKNEYY